MLDWFLDGVTDPTAPVAGQSTENELADLLAGWRENWPALKLILVVVSPAVTRYPLSLQPKQAKLFDRVAPYMLEDQVSADIETLAFISDRFRKPVDHRVSVVDKQWLETLKARLEDQALYPDVVLPIQALQTPGNEMTTLGLMATSHYALLVTPENTWLCRPSELSSLCALYARQLPETTERLKLLFVGDAGMNESQRDALASQLQIAADVETLEVENLEVPSEGPSLASLLPWLTSAEKHSPLFAHGFGTGGQATQKFAGLWRFGKAVVVLIALVALINLLQGRVYEFQASRAQAQAEQLYQRIFPGERIRSLSRQLEGHLKRAGSSDGAEGFLPLLQVLADGLNADHSRGKVKLIRLSFDQRLAQLKAELEADSLKAVDRLRENLEQAGIRATVNSAVETDQGYKAQLVLSGEKA